MKLLSFGICYLLTTAALALGLPPNFYACKDHVPTFHPQECDNEDGGVSYAVYCGELKKKTDGKYTLSFVSGEVAELLSSSGTKLSSNIVEKLENAPDANSVCVSIQVNIYQPGNVLFVDDVETFKPSSP